MRTLIAILIVLSAGAANANRFEAKKSLLGAKIGVTGTITRTMKPGFGNGKLHIVQNDPNDFREGTRATVEIGGKQSLTIGAGKTQAVIMHQRTGGRTVVTQSGKHQVSVESYGAPRMEFSGKGALAEAIAHANKHLDNHGEAR